MAAYKISAFIDEYSDELDVQVEALKKYGIKYVELRHCDGKNVSEWTPDDNARIKAALDSAGISASAIGSPLGKISIDGDIKAHMELARKVFATANFLGAKLIRVFSFYIPKGEKAEKYRAEVIAALGCMLDIADEYGVVLCHENEAGIYGESPENCLDLLREFGGRLKCVFDMGNFVLDGHEPYPHCFGLLNEYIEYFHIKDSLYEGAIVPAGKGKASIKEVLSAYSQKSEREVFVTLEPHLQTFAGLNALVGKSFDNPYKYENQMLAFDDDVEKFKEILREIK